MNNKKKEVIPTNFNVASPVFDTSKALTHMLGRACVDGMKIVLKGAGETVEFGTAIIIRNDGSKQKTKKK